MKLNVGIKGLKKGTNILELRVPDALRRRCLTGVEWFDDSIGGDGFVPSTSMMLTGGPGCGKTTMLMQLADSLTGQGHTVLFNTGEESLYQVRMVAERLQLSHGFTCGQDTLLPDMLEHADSLHKADPKKHCFILQDSLQTLDDGFYKNGATNGNTPLRCTEMLTDWSKSTNGIVVFIGQVNKGGDFSGRNTIRHAVDIHGHLFFDDDKRSETYCERLYTVTKNRWGVTGKTYIVGLGNEGLFEKGCFSMPQDELKKKSRQ